VLVVLAALNVVGVYAARHALAWYQRQARDQARIEVFCHQQLAPHSVVMGIEELWYAVSKANCELRIWAKPDPARHRYFITPLGQQKTAPSGYQLKATLPDIMPRVFGRTGWFTNLSYDLWEAEVPPLPIAVSGTPGEATSGIPPACEEKYPHPNGLR